MRFPVILMILLLLTGDALLTTRISQIFGDVCVRVVPGDATLHQRLAEAKLAQPRQLRSFAEREDFTLIQGTGKFDQ